MIKLFRFLLLFQMIFLVLAGIDFYISSDIESIVKILISSMLIIDGILYFISMFLLKIKSMYISLLFSFFIIVNILFTFADEVGLWDYIILLANIFILCIFYYIKKVGKPVQQ